MRIWKCEECGKQFRRHLCGKNRPVRFCSQTCYHKWNRRCGKNRGRFKPGAKSWCAGTKGIMKVNSGSFQKGQPSKNLLPLGSVTIRTDKNSRKRAWVKVAENMNIKDWKLRAVVVWEKAHGKLFAGAITHHIDKDTLNDSLDNLQCVTRAGHLMIHRPDFERKKHTTTTGIKHRHVRNCPRKQIAKTSKG